MGKLFMLSICGICLSIWGIIQLAIMGYAFKVNSPSLLEDAEPHDYIDYDDFVKQCQRNYQIAAKNCFITSACYIALLVISILCFVAARARDKMETKLREDDELSCSPKLPKKKWLKKN